MVGKRGPKPQTENERQNSLLFLEGEATGWASFLFELRGGRSGGVWWVRPNPRGPECGDRVCVAPIPAERERAEELIKVFLAAADSARQNSRPGGWLVLKPILPKPEAWEFLKNGQIEKATDQIDEWVEEQAPGRRPHVEERSHFLRVNRDHLWHAIQMPSYPLAGLKRPLQRRDSSDDKRIRFLARALAGLACGLSPATAIKRLGKWKLSKDVLMKGIEETALKYPMPTRKKESQQEETNQ